MKKCRKCEVNKSLSDFYQGGKDSYCKECRKTLAKKWKQANPEKVTESNAASQKRRKEKVNANSRKWRSRNKQRVQEINGRFNQKNPGYSAEACRKWRAKNVEKSRSYPKKRRALQEQAATYFVTDSDLKSLEAPCFACASTDSVHQDHIIPITRGGTHGIGNLRPMCKPCNSSKHGLTWTEWKYSGRPRAVEVFGKSAPLAA